MKLEKELINLGNIEERMPVVTDGLYAHFPFDGTLEGETRKNLLDTSKWVVGTKGSQGMFGRNGTNDENEIIMKENPWGYKEPVWASLQNDATSNDDGGWSVNNIPVDNTMKYRLSVMIRRENVGNGSTYFGCQGNTVENISAGTVNTNPYFYSHSVATVPQVADNWLLYVAHIHPAGYVGNSDPNTGIYDMSGNKLKSMTDFRWTPTTKVGGHRTYQYYSTSVNEKHYWVRPRMEICDGYEASIKDLLSDRENTTNPIVASNVTLEDDGVSIEQSKSNILSPNQRRGIDWSQHAGATVKSMTENVYVPEWGTDKATRVLITGGTSVIKYYATGPAQSQIVEGEYYSTSVKLKNNGITRINLNSNRGATYYGPTHIDPGEAIEAKWVTNSYAVNTGGNVQIQLRTVVETDDIDVTIHEAQITKSLHPMAFVDGNKAAGNLKIPFNLKPPYSIHFSHQPFILENEVKDQATSPMILQIDPYYSNASMSIWNYNKRLVTYGKGNTSAGWTTVVTHAELTAEDWNNREHSYTFVMESARLYKLYMDGKLMSSGTSTEDLTNVSNLYIGQYSMPNAKYKNFSIYNKALSADEVDRLGTKRMSQNKESVNISNINQYSLKKPKDVFYYPLDINSDSENRVYRVSKEENTVYENGAVFVGSATKNEYSYPTFNIAAESGGWSHWGSTGHIGDYGRNEDAQHIFTYGQKQSHWFSNGSAATSDYLLYQSPSYTGGMRSLQFILKEENGLDINESIVYPVWNAGNGGVPHGRWTNIQRIGDSDWHLCKCEGFSQDGTNNLVGIYVKPGYKIYVDSAILENKEYGSPFVETTRGSANLEFNLYESIGLDWSKDWTISYWKKPVGTTNTLLTAYNIDSLGTNSNTVGGGYQWWGKNSGTNSIRFNAGALSPTFSPNQYFNEWRMVTLVKSGSTITYTEQSRTLGKYTTQYVNNITKPNYYLSQRGYDLKLGGYDGGNAPNSYYKDLIIAKRALTETEIQSLYSTDLSLAKDVLYTAKPIKD